MNIDEARDRLKEHDALKAFVTAMKTVAPDAEPETFPVRFEVAKALLPVALWRCNELALAFEEQKSEPAPAAPASLTVPSGRPKVKPAVVERWNELSAAGKDFTQASPGAWEEWALKKGFKWSSVQNVLRELAADREKQRLAERQKDPLNAGVTKAAENFAKKTDADIQVDAPAGLPSGVFHTK